MMCAVLRATEVPPIIILELNNVLLKYRFCRLHIKVCTQSEITNFVYVKVHYISTRVGERAAAQCRSADTAI